MEEARDGSVELGVSDSVETVVETVEGDSVELGTSESDETVVETVKGDSVELGLSDSDEAVVETVKGNSDSVLELSSTEEDELTMGQTVVLERTETAWQGGRAATPENND